MEIIRFRVESGEPRWGYPAGSSVADLRKREPQNAVATIHEALGAERPLYHRRYVTLLCAIDLETIAWFDNCHRHDVTDGYDPHIGDLAPREMPSSTTSFATNGTEIPLSAMFDNGRPGVKLGLTVGEQPWWTPSDCCLVSEYHEQCVRVGS